MSRIQKIVLVLVFGLWFSTLLYLLIQGNQLSILNPAGIIAEKQKNLIYFATLLSLIIVLPVFVLTFFIAWHYREGNKKAKYSPDWDRSRNLETIWWGVPLVLIIILSVVTFKTSHDLDPFKPIEASGEPIKIQVVALQWKWLFIYPEENIATVNYLQLPVDRPIKFEITSDAPMNSFWIPNLGGQIYAMSGMSTELNLMAEKPGTYRGSSANISGRGFSGMNFNVNAVSDKEYDFWLETVRSDPKNLDGNSYSNLVVPSENNKPTYYGKIEPGLYRKVISKYTSHEGEH